MWKRKRESKNKEDKMAWKEQRKRWDNVELKELNWKKCKMAEKMGKRKE